MRAAMPSFSIARLFTMPGGAALHNDVLYAYAPPLLAFGVALALGLAGRATGARWPVAASGAVGALAGWMALLPWTAALRAVLAPRAMADFLLLPAAAAALAGLAASRLRGRAERWLPWALMALVGWWLARSATAQPEFWRVWLTIVLAAWLLARGVEGAGGRALAVGLALWGALLQAGAPPVWIVTALVAAAASAAAWPLGGTLPPVLLAAAATAADLGSGRLVQGRLNAADLACLLAPGAAWLVPRIAPGLAARFGRAGPVLAVPAAAALTAGVAWLGVRLLHR